MFSDKSSGIDKDHDLHSENNSDGSEGDSDSDGGNSDGSQSDESDDIVTDDSSSEADSSEGSDSDSSSCGSSTSSETRRKKPKKDKKKPVKAKAKALLRKNGLRLRDLHLLDERQIRKLTSSLRMQLCLKKMRSSQDADRAGDYTRLLKRRLRRRPSARLVPSAAILAAAQKKKHAWVETKSVSNIAELVAFLLPWYVATTLGKSSKRNERHLLNLIEYILLLVKLESKQGINSVLTFDRAFR